MLTKRASKLIALPIVVLLATVTPAAAQTDVTPNPAQEPKRPDTESELAAFIAELDPPTVEEIIASLQPIPTLEEVLAPLPDDPNAPYKRVLTGDDMQRVEELEKRITALREQGKYRETITLAEEVSTVRSRVQGEGHWEATDARRLVETLKHVAVMSPKEQADLAKADTADAEVAQLYQQSKYPRATDLAKRQLEIRRRVLGNEDPDVAHTLYILSVLLDAQGDFAWAEALDCAALKIFRKVLSDEHPDVGSALGQLGRTLSRRADYARAELLGRKGVATLRQLLGDDHDDVASYLTLQRPFWKANRRCRARGGCAVRNAVWRFRQGRHAHPANGWALR